MRPFRVFVSPVGNAFMTDIAEVVVAALADLDREVEFLRSGLPGGADTVDIVVAPHEYYHLMDDVSEQEKHASAARAIQLTVEQPGTQWFEIGYGYCRFAPLTLDINRTGVAELAARGVAVRHVPLGYHPSWDEWRGDDARERPLDVLFMGALMPRRNVFLAREAAVLASLDSRLNLTDPARPVTGPAPNFVTGREKHELLASAKILLNVHQQDSSDYFEWHRVLPAIANGCLVVTEPSADTSPLEPFRHFVQAPLDALAPLVRALARDDDRRLELTRRAYAFVREHTRLTDTLAALLPTLEAITPRPRPNGRPPLRAVPRRPVLRRRPPPAPPPAPVVDAGHFALFGALAGVQALVKDVALQNVRLRRRLDRLEAGLHGDGEADVVCSRAYESTTPDVSVVVSLYNYAAYIEECLTSALASRGVTVELIVVDDHSTDDGRDRVAHFVERHPHRAITLIAKAVNEGPSVARNVGFEAARSPYVFVMDADNLLFPAGLAKLTAALHTTGRAFAYPILARFGEEGHGTAPAHGLASEFPWELARLLKGNYIDAMSLVDRSAWKAVGGFDREVDERFGGLEDYDFWLALAARGLEGVQVPEILGRYRVQPGSRTSILNLDVQEVNVFFRRKFPTLPWDADED